MAYGILDTPDFSAQVAQLTHLALQSGDPLGFIRKYQTSPTSNRLAAQLAYGDVLRKVQGDKNQQAIDQYNPRQPTVLDHLEQQRMQGLAAMPTVGGMFDPGVYTQGGIGAGLGDEEEQQMAQGGVVAFAGPTGSLVTEGELTDAWYKAHPEDARFNPQETEPYRTKLKEFQGPKPPEADAEDWEARKKEIIKENKARDARKPGAAPRSTVPPETITAENDVALKRAIEQGKARAAAAKDAVGINAGRPAATVAPSGIAGGNVPPAVEAVAPKAAPAAPATPPPAATAGTAEAAAGAEKSLLSRAAGTAKNAASGLGTLGRLVKWGVGAPLAAELGWMGGQYVGNQLNEYTPIQEYIRNKLDTLGMTSPEEDRANAAMQPGYIEGQVQQRQGTAQAGLPPVIGAIADNVAKEEAGGSFFDPKSLARVNPQQTSYGSFQLDVSGGLPAFVKEYGGKFGLTAKPGTPEFTKQWQEAASKNPAEFGAAQLKAFEKGYLNPVRNQLSTILPGEIDPKVLSYFASRGVQYGPGSITRDKADIMDMYNSADGDIGKFLRNMSVYDTQNYARTFKTESSKKDTDRNKYTFDAHAKRVQQRLDNALGTTAGERFRGDVSKGVDTAKEVADVVAQQPAVQGVMGVGRGLVDKAGTFGADMMERAFPIRTGLEPPKPATPAAAAPTVYDQYMNNPNVQNAAYKKASEMTDDKSKWDDIALALMLSGAKTLAGTSRYAGVNIGAGLEEGLKGYIGQQAKREERAAKAGEKELDRAEKQYAARQKSAAAGVKQMFPDPERSVVEIDTLVNYAALKGMSPAARRANGFDDATYRELEKTALKLMQQIKGAPAAGSKGKEPNPGWGQVVQGKG